MPDKPEEYAGAQGRCYEDFEVGAILRHPLGRTINETDNTWFTLLTANTNPIHFDAYYSAQTEFKRPLLNSCFTLALVVGLSVNDVSRNAVNLGWDEVRLPAPVFAGDTLYAQSEVLSKRESKSRPQQGLIEIRTVGFNQEGTVVLSYRRTILVYKRGFAPRIPQPSPAGTGRR
ncbi:MAG: MaoC family dehydratase [Terriglobales bacterium]